MKKDTNTYKYNNKAKSLKMLYEIILTVKDDNAVINEKLIIAKFNALGDAYQAATKLNEQSPVNFTYTVQATGSAIK